MSRALAALVAAVAISVGAIAGPAAAHTELATSPHTAVPAAPSPQAIAVAAYARMSPSERVGQLFMAGVPSSGPSQSEQSALAEHHVGDVILDGNSSRSQHSVHRMVKRLASALRTAGVSPFVSTDQEGGDVQRLRGPGFSAMPTALAQGTLSASQLRADSKVWGAQLLGAGVNLDLAPVADTVPAKHASRNQPIGQYKREFGHTPAVVAPHVVAFIHGLNAAGVAATTKHFPGLGRATGNTDTSAHVTDPTTRHDPYLVPFSDAVKAGTQFVMVSSATYPHIDPAHLACFSTVVITKLLRGQLHFSGPVISDDFGTTALASVPVGRRATEFFHAGGTMLLDTSFDQIPSMIKAVKAARASNPAFAKQIKAAVLVDLTAKAAASLIQPKAS